MAELDDPHLGGPTAVERSPDAPEALEVSEASEAREAPDGTPSPDVAPAGDGGLVLLDDAGAGRLGAGVVQTPKLLPAEDDDSAAADADAVAVDAAGAGPDGRRSDGAAEEGEVVPVHGDLDPASRDADGDDGFANVTLADAVAVDGGTVVDGRILLAAEAGDGLAGTSFEGPAPTDGPLKYHPFEFLTPKELQVALNANTLAFLGLPSSRKATSLSDVAVACHMGAYLLTVCHDQDLVLGFFDRARISAEAGDNLLSVARTRFDSAVLGTGDEVAL